MQIRDCVLRYGVISRSLHWLVAVLIAWQLIGMGAREVLGREHPVAGALSGNHSQVGTVLFVLIVCRVLWALSNRRNRPPHAPGLPGQAARLGHAVLYALMLAVPVAALVRAWGGERGFAPFGFQIFAPRQPDQVVGTATAIGDNFHGEMAWVLAVLILGHIAMALIHHLVKRDGTLRRMA